MPKPPLSEAELLEGRRRIGRAAEQLMVSKGTTALSMRAIAQKVDLTAGALYRYFPSKAELLTFCWTDALEELALRFDEFAASDLDPVESLRRMIRAYAKFGLEDANRFKVLFMPEAPDAQAEPTEPIPRAFLLAMTQAELAVSQERFVDIAPAKALRILWACVHGMLALKDTDPSPDFEYDIELVMTAVDIAIHGLSTRRPTK